MTGWRLLVDGTLGILVNWFARAALFATTLRLFVIRRDFDTISWLEGWTQQKQSVIGGTPPRGALCRLCGGLGRRATGIAVGRPAIAVPDQFPVSDPARRSGACWRCFRREPDLTRLCRGADCWPVRRRVRLRTAGRGRSCLITIVLVARGFAVRAVGRSRCYFERLEGFLWGLTPRSSRQRTGCWQLAIRRLYRRRRVGHAGAGGGATREKCSHFSILYLFGLFLDVLLELVGPPGPRFAAQSISG